MLITSAGRTFCAMPKSTCQTSPRLGSMGLFFVKGSKGCRCESGEIIVGEIVAHGNRFRHGMVQLQLFSDRKLFDDIEKLKNGGAHV